jgi:hypothetical protein
MGKMVRADHLDHGPVMTDDTPEDLPHTYCDWCGAHVLLKDQALETLAKLVYAHALLHYEDGGWDVIVECYTTDSIVSQWIHLNDEYETPLPTTEAEAIQSWEGVVDVWADRQADARNSAF